MDETARETQHEIKVEQEAGRFLVIGWQILFFDLILWIFVPDEFRVGQYAVTLCAIIGFILGVTLVLIGMAQRKRVRGIVHGEAAGHLHSH
jgi:hypothetical protein